MLFGNQASEGKQPTTPTIGVPTDGGTGTSVLVPFTPSTYIGKGTITYTATSSPGSITGTSATSPITVTGLTTGTSYQFTVTGTTNYGVNSLASAASLPVTPVAPTAFDSIATASGTGSSGTITFSSIPSTYKHLQIRGIANDATFATLTMQFNSNSSASYFGHYLRGNGSTASVGSTINTTSIPYAAYASGNTNEMGAFIIDIHDYASTTKNKTVRSFFGDDRNGSGLVWLSSGAWNNTSAISSITITDPAANFTTTSTFALYGIKG